MKFSPKQLVDICGGLTSAIAYERDLIDCYGGEHGKKYADQKLAINKSKLLIRVYESLISKIDRELSRLPE